MAGGRSRLAFEPRSIFGQRTRPNRRDDSCPARIETPMKMHHLSAVELRDAFLKGEISALNIAQHFLKRIEKYGPSLGAFLSVLGPRVLGRAEALDKKRGLGKPLGKLAGIPIAIKDNMHIAGETTTCGSKFLQNYKAPFDAM